MSHSFRIYSIQALNTLNIVIEIRHYDRLVINLMIASYLVIRVVG